MKYEIELSDDVDCRIEVLRQKLGLDSKEEVLRRALGFCDWFVKERQAGSRILVISTNWFWGFCNSVVVTFPGWFHLSNFDFRIRKEIVHP